MAVNVTTILAGANSHISDVEATADGDTTTGNIAHGLGEAPLIPFVTPRAAEARISLWICTSDATNYVLLKATTGGSGVAGVQVRGGVLRPHSIFR